MLEATLALATLVREVYVTSHHHGFPVKTPFTVVAAEPIPARITRRRQSQTRGLRKSFPERVDHRGEDDG